MFVRRQIYQNGIHLAHGFAQRDLKFFEAGGMILGVRADGFERHDGRFGFVAEMLELRERTYVVSVYESLMRLLKHGWFELGECLGFGYRIGRLIERSLFGSETIDWRVRSGKRRNRRARRDAVRRDHRQAKHREALAPRHPTASFASRVAKTEFVAAPGNPECRGSRDRDRDISGRRQWPPA